MTDNPNFQKQDARCEKRPPCRGANQLKVQGCPSAAVFEKTHNFIKTGKVFDRHGKPVKLTESTAVALMLKFFFEHVNVGEPIYLKS